MHGAQVRVQRSLRNPPALADFDTRHRTSAEKAVNRRDADPQIVGGLGNGEQALFRRENTPPFRAGQYVSMLGYAGALCLLDAEVSLLAWLSHPNDVAVVSLVATWLVLRTCTGRE